MTYRTDTDIKIKLPKKKFLELKNDMVFKIDLSYSESYDELAYILTNVDVILTGHTHDAIPKAIKIRDLVSFDFNYI